jgi:transposase-like protein
MAKGVYAEKTVREIRRKTRRRFSAEEKIRIVLEGLRVPEPGMALQALVAVAVLRRRRWG